MLVLLVIPWCSLLYMTKLSRGSVTLVLSSPFKWKEGSFFSAAVDTGHYSHIGILFCHIIRVMLQLGISWIPDRHIMIRWTRDIIPEETAMPSLTYRHRLLTPSALRMITEGDCDAETFEIAMKHMHRAFMEMVWMKGTIVQQKNSAVSIAMVVEQMVNQEETFLALQDLVLA